MLKLKLNKMAVICASFRQEGDIRSIYVKSNLDSQCSHNANSWYQKCPSITLLFFSFYFRIHSWFWSIHLDYIYVFVSSQEVERLCICVSFSMIVLLDFVAVLTVWYCLFFILLINHVRWHVVQLIHRM